MTRGNRAGRPSSPRYRLWLVGALLLALVGCARQQMRLQAEDEGDRDRYAIETVRNVAQFDNTEPLPVAGVGLVTGLAGTGGDAPPGDFRTMLENDLKKRGVTNVKQVLADKNHSMVLVSALYPAGARKGDPIDIEVSLPPGSKTTSLRGGYLQKCVLFNYDFAERVAPNFAEGNTNALKGHPVVEAEGAVIVGLGDGDEAARVKRGRIWSGGRCRRDRPFVLVLNENKRFATVSKLVADRINETFQSPFNTGFNNGTAVASKDYVVLQVPPQYRLNLQRYLRVVGLVPLRVGGEGAPRSSQVAENYRRRLEEEILDPAHAVTAALRLEALGDSSRAVLKKGLTSEHALVRFCAAEGLAYLNDPACAKELGRAVVEQPALRAFALTALASFDEAVSQETLVDLLSSANPETRYGAFRALRALNEREPAVQGEYLNEAFWLHKVAPGTPGLVHVSGRKRPEVVLFGEEPFLRAPFGFRAGEFNVTAAEGNNHCIVSHFAGNRAERRQCSLKLEDVLRTLASLGADYADVVEVVRQARGSECLTCSVEVDALPQATSVYALQRAGERAKAHGDGQAVAAADDEEIVNARAELGATPTLFEKHEAAPLRGADAGDGAVERKKKKDTATAERRAKDDTE
jgi:hypothetical protein